MNTTKLRELLGRATPLRAEDGEGYAEVFDASGFKVALTVKPELILALNEMPALLDEVDRIRTTLRLCHHYWMVAAKEALQGDSGKLRKHVAISDGKTLDDVVAEMAAALGDKS